MDISKLFKFRTSVIAMFFLGCSLFFVGHNAGKLKDDSPESDKMLTEYLLGGGLVALMSMSGFSVNREIEDELRVEKSNLENTFKEEKWKLEKDFNHREIELEKAMESRNLQTAYHLQSTLDKTRKIFDDINFPKEFENHFIQAIQEIQDSINELEELTRVSEEVCQWLSDEENFNDLVSKALERVIPI
ncbi:hypothetical protein [Leptolyngbya sp. CCY15150]|uniref:hypothetical protein n=1 Tax=Leptolyngbya sp. CCY15150 TaxID=2767772 RepID=UPI001950F703|nr:hypothetical protein [Leptolyngbya sp. CCY15150]